MLTCSLALHKNNRTVLTWLNATPQIVTTLDWYHDRFQNYGYNHHF